MFCSVVIEVGFIFKNMVLYILDDVISQSHHIALIATVLVIEPREVGVLIDHIVNEGIHDHGNHGFPFIVLLEDFLQTVNSKVIVLIYQFVHQRIDRSISTLFLDILKVGKRRNIQQQILKDSFSQLTIDVTNCVFNVFESINKIFIIEIQAIQNAKQCIFHCNYLLIPVITIPWIKPRINIFKRKNMKPIKVTTFYSILFFFCQSQKMTLLKKEIFHIQVP